MKQLSLIFKLLLLLSMYANVQAQVGLKLGTESGTKDANAVLDLGSVPGITNAKGLLLPRVALQGTTILAPFTGIIASGMMVYNTANISDVTPGNYYYDGIKWIRISTDNLYTANGILAGARTVTQSTNPLTFTGTGNLLKYSGSATVPSIFEIGRTTTDAQFGVAGAANDGFTGSVAGDAWLKAGSAISPSRMILGTSGSRSLRFMTDNTQRMVVDSVGNVGIGTNVPDARLDVQGNFNNGQIVVGNTGNAGRIRFRRGTDGDPNGIIGWNGATEQEDFSIQNTTGQGFISFYTQGPARGSYPSSGTTERMRVTGEGVVIIDTVNNGSYTSPYIAALDVSSKRRGFLPPRMTAVQIQAVPVESTSEGLIIYCTDCVPKGILTYNGKRTEEGWRNSAGNTFPPTATAPAIAGYGNYYEVSTAGTATNFSSSSYTWQYSKNNGSTWNTLGSGSTVPGNGISTINVPDSLYGNQIRVLYTVNPISSSYSSQPAYSPLTVASNVVNYQPLFDQAAISSTVRAIYGLRKLRSAYTGPAIKVKNISTAASTDISFLASGMLDTTALKMAFTGTQNLIVTTWYDQSGNNRHVTSATDAAAPYIVLTGVIQKYEGSNNRPTLVFNKDGLSETTFDKLTYTATTTLDTISVSGGIELLFAVRQTNNLAQRNGGLVLTNGNAGNFTGTQLNTGNYSVYFGTGTTNSVGPGEWYDAFCTPGGSGARPSLTETVITGNQNYVGSIKNTGVLSTQEAYLPVVLNSSYFTTLTTGTTRTTNYYKPPTSLGKIISATKFTPKIGQFSIGTNEKTFNGSGPTYGNKFPSMFNYSEVYLLQSVPDANARRRIFGSLGGYYGVPIGSDGTINFE